ncbi:unnamed protein product [Ceutorhynchus assimilis]|uniref:Uncharacterized protein n=1 Tax=Ceutorhynchus assimilis TaxID=467358 RepID=A0A9N9QDK3_9CUCU|nr:unnamed protein product [Ceutorhynchus assimilis]
MSSSEIESLKENIISPEAKKTTSTVLTDTPIIEEKQEILRLKLEKKSEKRQRVKKAKEVKRNLFAPKNDSSSESDISVNEMCDDDSDADISDEFLEDPNENLNISDFIIVQ